MEPTVDTFVLHPALLIASGFESLSSKQVRFLNSYRRHFYSNTIEFSKTNVISKKDFELGGIMNPFDQFFDIDSVYRQSSQLINNFPYLTYREIQTQIYFQPIRQIWRELLTEVFLDLSSFCIATKRSRDFFQAATPVLHEISSFPVYNKICALHSCGLGGKLSDAFAFLFEKFKTVETHYNKPFAN